MAKIRILFSGDFADGNYTANPAWTVSSGAWSVTGGALAATPASGTREIYAANGYAGTDVWFRFKRGHLDGFLDTCTVYLRWVHQGPWGVVKQATTAYYTAMQTRHICFWIRLIDTDKPLNRKSFFPRQTMLNDDL